MVRLLSRHRSPSPCWRSSGPCLTMSKKYQITLTESERATLVQRVSAGHDPARDLTHARILLKADSGPHGPAWTDEAIATAIDTSLSTIARVRQRFAEQGLAAALHRQL